MCRYLAVIIVLTFPFMLQAGVTVGATRIIYDADKKEAFITVHNSDKAASLIQSWVEDKMGGGSSPFIVTPPLFRLDGERESKVRVILTSAELPQDKESLFFLNVKTIPGRMKSNDNRLSIAINNRMKLLYRPASLNSEGAQDAYRNLQPTQSGEHLNLYNPTPYVLSLYQIRIGDHLVQSTVTVEPFSTVSVMLNKPHAGKLSWQAIGDFGNVLEMVTKKI